MSKKQLMMTLCACTMMQSASAAYITSVNTNGNNVVDYGSVQGQTWVDVEFFNQQTVSITFDNSVYPEDLVSMHFYNSTGVGWSGFEFQLIGAGFGGPLAIEPQTTTLSSYTVHATDFSDLYYDYTTHFTLGFDGLETNALLNGTGRFVTAPYTSYTLLLTPTTVPVPAAVWLFGSGLLGLIGVARRKI